MQNLSGRVDTSARSQALLLDTAPETENLSVDALYNETNVRHTGCKAGAEFVGSAPEGIRAEVIPRSLGRAAPRDFRESHSLVEVCMSRSLVNSTSLARLAEAPPPGFKCALSYGGLASAWVAAAGELDLASARELEQILRDAVTRARLVVLDLRELAFIDSAGVHVIVDVCVRAERALCRVVVIQGAPQVQRVFAMTGLDQLLETVADPAEINAAPARSALTLL